MKTKIIVFLLTKTIIKKMIIFRTKTKKKTKFYDDRTE